MKQEIKNYPLGLNNLLFTYEEIIEIMKDEHHDLYSLITTWFGTYDDDQVSEDEMSGLIYAGECEIWPGDYWLVNIKTNLAIGFTDINDLEAKIKCLEKGDSGEV